MQSIRAFIVLFFILVAACVSNPTPARSTAPVAAAYGVIKIRFIDNRVVRDSAYPPGVYDVPLDADNAQVATPALLDGRLLVNAAWFSGQYPPPKEMDVLRGDSITFGHYTIRDRVLFIGQTPTKASTYLLRATDTVQVGEPLEWAFLPDDASQKNEGTFNTIYEIPSGFLVRVFQWHDHEGFGVDEFTSLYLYESGRWRLFARAERFRAY